MSKIPLEKLVAISASAQGVITTCLGQEPAHGNCDVKIELWDELNDRIAPPHVVKAMADELIELRRHNQNLRQQRILDRRRFSNPEGGANVVTLEVMRAFEGGLNRD